jgi:hypothetical protein
MVYLDRQRLKPFYIETTMMGSVNLGEGKHDGGDGSMMSGRRVAASHAVFDKAVDYAGRNAVKHLIAHDVTFLDVDSLRKMGLGTF